MPLFKSWHKAEKQPQTESPKCPNCDSPIATVTVPSGIGSYSHLKGIPADFVVKLCRRCMRVDLNPDQVPSDIMTVFVGRVVRVDRMRFRERMVQLQTNYPQTIAGKLLRFSFYSSIRKGDKIAVAGQRLREDLIEPILVRNISSKIDETGGSVADYTLHTKADYKLPPDQRLTLTNPLIAKASAMIGTALETYEGQMTTIPANTEGELSPSEFEMLTANLFERLGYNNVIISGGASDKGVDIRASRSENGQIVQIVVQCKHQSVLNRVTPTQVRDFAHSIERERGEGVTRGYFVTSSYFSPECFDKENCGDSMELIDREQLEILLKNVGLKIPTQR